MVQIANLEQGDYWKHLGMSLTEDDGKIKVTAAITPELKQFYGNVHGGVLASLMDSAIAVAINQFLDSNLGASTVELNISYLYPVNEGILWAEGKVVKKGRRIIVGQGEIKDDSGRLVAIGTATFMITTL